MKRFLQGKSGRFVDLYHVKIVDTWQSPASGRWFVSVSCGGMQDLIAMCDFDSEDIAVGRATDIMNLAGTVKDMVDLRVKSGE